MKKSYILELLKNFIYAEIMNLYSDEETKTICIEIVLGLHINVLQ